jgi:hypothetical protein
MLEHEEKYLVSFKRSVGYLKLLAELDLLKVKNSLRGTVIYAHSAYGKQSEIRGEVIKKSIFWSSPQVTYPDGFS